jgi:hypothetical protein
VSATQKIATADARRTYPRLFQLWSSRGLSPRAASALALAGCETVEQVTNLGRAWFQRPNIGAKTLAELSTLAGWPPEHRTPVDAIAASLGLSIPDPEAARDAAMDAVIGLRRAGFVIAAKRSEPVSHR